MTIISKTANPIFIFFFQVSIINFDSLICIQVFNISHRFFKKRKKLTFIPGNYEIMTTAKFWRDREKPNMDSDSATQILSNLQMLFYCVTRGIFNWKPFFASPCLIGRKTSMSAIIHFLYIVENQKKWNVKVQIENVNLLNIIRRLQPTLLLMCWFYLTLKWNNFIESQYFFIYQIP